ncbi:MAG: hypothetical protein V2I54_13605 [Bacteroidales bacterium]|jgi:hypothetical protein|nr:hypothetical protein [Bacteroidales bacterium]
MDFKEIKDTWKKSFENDKLLDKREIELRLKIKGESNTALRKIKKSYKSELVICGGLGLFVVFWFFLFSSGSVMIFINGLNILFFGSLFLFCWNNYRKIKNTFISTDKLKPALRKTIDHVEWYVDFNRSNFTRYILLPFAALYGMSMGYLSNMEVLSWEEILNHLNNLTLISSLVIIFLVSLIAIPFSQYLSRKMYKQHLDELKRCLKEFEDIDEFNFNHHNTKKK